MYQKDYILRLIEQVGAFLRRMLQAISEQRPEEALETSREALGRVLDLDPAFVESLAPESLVSLLGAGGRLDSARTLLLGEVFLRRMQARLSLGDAGPASVDRRKAELLLTAVVDLGEADDIVRAQELLAELRLLADGELLP